MACDQHDSIDSGIMSCEKVDSKLDENIVSDGVVDVVLINKHPQLQGFGIDISGGIDRPYIEEDNGIFISAVKEKGLAEKCGLLGVGDKILEVNGTSVLLVSHEEAVKLFISDRSQVKLRVHKSYALLLKAASLTPSPTSSTEQSSPISEEVPSPATEKSQENRTSLSISGFLTGLAIGCICVVLLRKYMITSKT